MIVGLGDEGVEIDDIYGQSLTGDAVSLLNSKGGVMEGYWDGVDINDVWNGDVVIDNAGYQDKGTNYAGGVIVGVNGDGVDIEEADGSVKIYNSYTNGDTLGGVDFKLLDKAATFTGGLFDADDSFDSATGVTGGAVGGIWGYNNGIKIEDVGEPGNDQVGNVSLWNIEGIVVGLNEDGLHWRNLASVADGSNYVAATIGNTAGMIWGGDDGIDIEDTQGDVNIDNSTYFDSDSVSPSYNKQLAGGNIVGIDDGIRLRDIEGDVYVSNDDGLIQGFYGDGIDIRHVLDGKTHVGENGGDVVIRNASNQNTYEGGGTIIAADSAIRIFDARSARIYNGEDGVIVGDGSYSQAVINLQTSDDGDAGAAGAQIYNSGIMGSLDLPTLNYNWTWNQAANTTPGSTLDTAQIWEDLGDFEDYLDSVGQAGDITNLSSYADAAQDVLVRSRWSTDDNLYSGGGTYISNDGLMVGRVRLTGRVEQGSNTYGNEIVNYGTWFTQDRNGYGNSMHGSDNDEIYNNGVIQTAFDSANDEKATFDQDYFANGNGYLGYSGIISMLDNAAGDTVDIYEEFYGDNYDGSSSYLVVDAHLGGYYDSDNESDVLNLLDNGDSSYIYGSTGIVVHNLNNGPSGLNDYGIDVVQYNSNTGIALECGGGGDSLCRDGDAFFISENSPNYVNIGGYGAIQNGFFATFLRQDETWNDFEFVTDWGVDAYAFPSLVTGAQNIWYDTAGVVQDHIYGNHFPLAGAGGGGADMAEPMPVVAEPVGGPALWGKVGGSWTTRDTSVTEDIGGSDVTFDTSYDQDTYSILAGVDYTHSNAWRFGVFGGYVSSSMDFDNYALSGDYSGGTVGAYAAYTAGAFYADATVKADFLSLDYTSAAVGEPSADVTNVGVLANTGYRFDMGRMYFEPIASFAYLNSSVDGGNYGGAEVDFDDGTSLRGGLGARVGGTFATGAGSTELALLGKVWNEFEDANSVTLTDNNTLDSQTFEDSIDGVFGEVTGTATYYNADRTFSGFVAGGVKFNSDFTTVSAQAGLRKKF